MPHQAYGVWHMNSAQLPERPSVNDARDRLVDCFAATHGAGFVACKAQLGLPTHPDAVRLTAEGLVRVAFNQVGGSFDHPTSDSLAKVVDLLAERSLSWGAPAEMVLEHQAQFQQIIAVTEQPGL